MEPCASRRIETLEPYQGIWRELYLLTDIDFTREILERGFTLGPGFAKRKATDIAYCIRQAKDYFDSAHVASLVTRPTLIYYGLISLAAVLHIVKSRDSALNTLPAKHGITINVPPGVSLKSGFLKCGAKLENGPFTALSKLGVADRFKVEWENEQLDWSAMTLKNVHLNTVQEGSTITLGYALSCVPEVRNELHLMGASSTAYPGKAYLDQDQSRLWLRFDKSVLIPKGDDLARELPREFAVLSQYRHEGDTHNASFFRSIASDPPLPRAGTSLFGGTVFFSDRSDAPELSQLQALYVAFFIMGSIARYRPHEWGPLVGDPSSNVGLLTATLCDTALIKLPLLALSEVTDTHITLS